MAAFLFGNWVILGNLKTGHGGDFQLLNY